MEARYLLTPKDVAVLLALAEGIVELTPTEIAVHARLIPAEVSTALESLKRQNLIDRWSPPGVRGDSVETLAVATLTSDGQSLVQELIQHAGVPPIGTTLQVRRRFPWLTSRQTAQLVIIPDESENHAHKM